MIVEVNRHLNATHASTGAAVSAAILSLAVLAAVLPSPTRLLTMSGDAAATLAWASINCQEDLFLKPDTPLTSPESIVKVAVILDELRRRLGTQKACSLAIQSAGPVLLTAKQLPPQRYFAN